MRRLVRLSDVFASEAALTVVVRLLDGPATQKALLKQLRNDGIRWSQPRLSGLMTRLEDLGLVTRRSRKAPYELTHADAVAAFVHHLAALSVAIAQEDAAASGELEMIARRARVRPARVDAGNDDA
jgi:DNA-binding HxlR family transcriptional regulator